MSFYRSRKKEMLHGALEKLPQYPHRHGKAEGHHRHIGGRQGKGGQLGVAVEDVHQGEADGGAQKAVEGVEHGVPVGENGVERADLAQDLGGVDEQEYDDLQGVRHVDMEPLLNEVGNEEQNEGKYAQKDAFKVPVEKLGDEDQNDGVTQDGVDRGQDLFLPGQGAPLLSAPALGTAAHFVASGAGGSSCRASSR